MANLRTRPARNPRVQSGAPFITKQRKQMNKRQRDAMRRTTSFGVLFVRGKSITKIRNPNGKLVEARNAGEPVVVSVRRFASVNEAAHHGKRFKKIEGHKSFHVIFVNAKPNAWVNEKTGKTNPLIWRKRTSR